MTSALDMVIVTIYWNYCALCQWFCLEEPLQELGVYGMLGLEKRI